MDFPTFTKVSSLPFTSISIDWSKFTQVEASGFSVDECIELVQRVPLLTDCKFVEVASDRQKYPHTVGAIIHASLNSFCLQPGAGQHPVIDMYLLSRLDFAVAPGAGPWR
jgi:hypothetical protein